MGASHLIGTAVAAALFVLLSLGGGCREPGELDPTLVLRAASADSSHIRVGFAEAIDPAFMGRTGNVRVERLPRGGGALLAVREAIVDDSVRGRSLLLTTDPVPDGTALRVTFHVVRLLSGTELSDRPLTVFLVTGLSYAKDIAPLFRDTCNGCHSGDPLQGNYATDSYLSLFGSGTAPPGDLLPGDPASLLVVKCLPSGAMFWKAGLETSDAFLIRDWVVGYAARP